MLGRRQLPGARTRIDDGPDDRGAIALIALFFAVFAIAMLYSFVGTVEAVFFRERMQDAADSAALSAAIVHARSMNFIVLVNIVMAALLAILIAIKVVQGLCIIGMVIAAALAWPTMGVSLAAIPPLQVVQSQMDSTYKTLKEPVYTALGALHDLAGTIKDTAPVAATAIVEADVQADWMPPVAQGFAVGSRADLPVEDDSFNMLCRKGGETLADFALLPLKPILDPVPGLEDALSSGMGDITAALSSWFCEDDGSSPPSFPRDEERAYPEMSWTQACEKDDPGDVDPSVPPKDVKRPACTEAERLDDQARPDAVTGSCKPGNDCSVEGPYEMRVQQARIECAPTSQPAPFSYAYQTREGEVEYEWKDNEWRRGTPRYGTPVAFPQDLSHPPPEASIPPCGPQALHPTGYNPIVRKSNDVNEVLPVCTTEEPPRFAPRSDEPLVRTVQFTEVSHILGCKKRIHVVVNVGNEPAESGGGNDKSPKRVLTKAKLGDENFQIRALMHGHLGDGGATRIVRLALWGRPAQEGPLESLRVLGDFSFAQAEYFFDGSGKADTWMWDMSWRARLRRFRLPVPDSSDSSDSDSTASDSGGSSAGGSSSGGSGSSYPVGTPSGSALADADSALQTIAKFCGEVVGDDCETALDSLRRLNDVVAH